MKSREYKNAVDNIRCSESFIKEMEEKLSSPISETHEYADSVSEVERVKPRSISRIIGTAAACAVVCVGIGLGVNAVKNAEYHTMPSYSTVDNSSSSTSGKYENLPSRIQDFTDMEWGARYDEGEQIILTYEQKAAVAELLNTISWDTDIAVETVDTPDNPICLNVRNNELDYVVRFYDNGSIGAFYSIGDDGVDCYDDNYWSAEKYQQLYDIIFGAEEETTEGATEDVQKAVSELLDRNYDMFLEGAETVNGNYTYAHFVASGENPTDKQFPVTKEQIDEIYWLLKQCEWKRIDYDFIYVNFYDMGAVFNTECQLILYDDESEPQYFKADRESILPLYDYLTHMEFDMKSQIDYSLGKLEALAEKGEIRNIKANALIRYYNDEGSYDGSGLITEFTPIDGTISNGIVYFSYDGTNKEKYTEFDGYTNYDCDSNTSVKSRWININESFLYTENYSADTDTHADERGFNEVVIDNEKVLYSTEPSSVVFNYWELYEQIPTLVSSLGDEEYSCETFTDYASPVVTTSWSFASTSGTDTAATQWHIDITYDEYGIIRSYYRYSNGELVESITLSEVDINFDYEFKPDYPEKFNTLISK